MKEQLLEPLLRRLRIKRIMPLIQKYPACNLLDIGCGWEAKFIREMESFITSGIGIDFKAPDLHTEKLHTYNCYINKELPFPDNSFELVTMLAVLEHLENTELVLSEVYRVLKPGGTFAGTVPSVMAKPVLEFLSFKLGIVNPDEIKDHKCYYNKKMLYKILSHNFVKIEHAYFQLGMNNFFMAEKGL